MEAQEITEIVVNFEIEIDINIGAANAIAGQEDNNEDKDKSNDLNRIVYKQMHHCICSGGDATQCGLSACSVSVSSKNQKKQWYYCIDCQKKGFEGWPPAVGYQTITLWIYHVHPTRKKRAGHCLNLTSQ